MRTTYAGREPLFRASALGSVGPSDVQTISPQGGTFLPHREQLWDRGMARMRASKLATETCLAILRDDDSIDGGIDDPKLTLYICGWRYNYT